MLQLAKRLTLNSRGAIDSTFKTNQYNMPLFEVVCPNVEDIGMFIYLMLCSNDKNNAYEDISLRLTIKKIFEILRYVRPNAIVINKNKTKYDSYRAVTQMDPHYWRNGVVGSTQTKCQFFCAIFIRKKCG